MLPRPGHEVSEPVEELKWGKLDDAAGVRPRGLPPSIDRFILYDSRTRDGATEHAVEATFPLARRDGGAAGE